jgi:hypothetical protein
MTMKAEGGTTTTMNWQELLLRASYRDLVPSSSLSSSSAAAGGRTRPPVPVKCPYFYGSYCYT